MTTWLYKKHHYEPGEYARTIKTVGEHLVVTLFDPGRGPIPADCPSAAAIVILANSGKKDKNGVQVVAPSIKCFDTLGNLDLNILPPLPGGTEAPIDSRIGISYPQPYPSLQTATSNFPGWYRFAQVNPTFPLVTNTDDSYLTYSTALLAELAEINTLVNTTYPANPDPPGVPGDWWNFISVSGSGDCEDYALEKAQRLLDLGYAASALHIETGKRKGTAVGEGWHAWLVVQTDQDDFCLDNLYSYPARYAVIRSAYESRSRQTGMYWNFIE
jgi:predicted transglutaminase-like cysteine proteinase